MLGCLSKIQKFTGENFLMSETWSSARSVLYVKISVWIMGHLSEAVSCLSKWRSTEFQWVISIKLHKHGMCAHSDIFNGAQSGRIVTHLLHTVCSNNNISCLLSTVFQSANVRLSIQKTFKNDFSVYDVLKVCKIFIRFACFR